MSVDCRAEDHGGRQVAMRHKQEVALGGPERARMTWTCGDDAAIVDRSDTSPAAIMLHSILGRRVTFRAAGVPRARRGVDSTRQHGLAATWVLYAMLLAVLPLCGARGQGQVLDRYFAANVPAYQDWFANLDTTGVGNAFEPLGWRAGTFVFHPSVSEGFGFDSNPAGTSAAHGSTVLDSSGAISLDSNWARDAVNAAVTVDDQRYFDDPRQSFTTWTASAGSTVEYGDDQIRLGYAHLNSVTLPTDVGNFGLAAPITNVVDDLRVSDTIGTGRFTLVPGVIGQLYRFSGNGSEAAADQLFDRDAVTGSLTAGYQFAGGHNLLLVLNDSEVDYHQGDGLPPPNYNDLSVLGGIEYRQSALLVYRALIGYEERFLAGHGANGGTITAPSAELDVIWTPTRLMSVTGRVSEGLQDEPTATGQGVKQTSVEAVLDYAFRRNVMLQASAQYGRASFPNGGGVEATYGAHASARWSLTRNWSLSLAYDYSRGDSSGAGGLGYTLNEILLQAKFQL